MLNKIILPILILISLLLVGCGNTLPKDEVFDQSKPVFGLASGQVLIIPVEQCSKTFENDLFVQGTLKFEKAFPRFNLHYEYTDKCLTGRDPVSVIEYHCDTADENYYISRSLEECPNGCSFGACLE
ncbi:hypothetical protein COY27_05270 [Candidatus Woesearchaeota archaeon CG_4_10_14_0_2_um_filter_33_13]|nr:MAG: hypothetical protein COY27_05270 [Candidatus Woesearchaeota archaeon CG_4_10_14_0_2_um_filter_33_13]